MPPWSSSVLQIFQSPVTYVIFVWGALLGSFFNVCIYRIPRHIFWKSSRSICPHCGAMIPFWLNVPIFSWVFLRGRAACCGAKISVQYPIVEALSGFIFVSLYWLYPFVLRWDGTLVLAPADLLRFVHGAIFCSVLIICSFIDLEHQIIPDVLSLPMIALTPLAVYLHPDLDWKSALYGVLLGGGIFYAVAWLYFLLRGESGLGMGDVKLLAAIGGWLGVQSILTTIFWASILGSLVGIISILVRRELNLKTRLPFGPFLSLAAVCYLLFGSKLAVFMMGF